MPDDPNPLGIVVLVVSDQGVVHGPTPQFEPEYEGDFVEAYIPLRHIPEGVLESQRAKLLKMNAEGGLRKLTDEEREKQDQLAAEVVVEEAEPETPATGSDLPDDLPPELAGGFS